MHPLVDPRAKALIFDIDGTLADTMAIHYKACQIVCNKYGFDFPYDYFLAKAGIPTKIVFRMLVEELGVKVNPEALSEEKEALFFAHIKETKPMPGIADIALEYYGKIPMGLGTGGIREMATDIIKTIQMEKYFSAMVTADDVKKPKPFPDTFLLCAEKLGVDPAFCQVFEDADPGLEAARSAGMIATDVRPFLKKNAGARF